MKVRKDIIIEQHDVDKAWKDLGIDQLVDKLCGKAAVKKMRGDLHNVLQATANKAADLDLNRGG